ncbi:MAG: permease-like cell division protein FtsX [Actinomycetota bacterium]|jgi:cell division transport system permease protein|nr:permease-like cell division protein FtsX [Actinomycetota bacterium]
MPVSVGYVSREAATNLWRNRLMTVAGILTVAVSLALVGSALLLKQGAATATAQWQQGVDVIVWVAPGSSPTQAGAIGEELRAVGYVERCAYRNQAYDFAESQRILPADLATEITQSDTPSSFRCVLANPSEATALDQQFSGKPGIVKVTYPSQQIRTMQSVIHVLQWAFLSVAVVLLLSASVLILNTIRMAIFARRREVSVMKLVGATNWFIRLPFMAEGLVQGLAGAGLSVIVVLLLYWRLGLGAVQRSSTSIFAQMHMGLAEVAGTCIFVGVVGVVVGVAGSAFAVRRFLDV